MFPVQLSVEAARSAWEEIPAAPGVFALFAEDPRAEPYISRTPNLRRRIRRLLDPVRRKSVTQETDNSAQMPLPEMAAVPPVPELSRRLQLAGRVARIEYALTGSDFEALLLLYNASWNAFGERARKRLHLRPPFLLRMTVENAYPRVYVTNRVTKSGVDDLYGPFASRAAAEQFLEDMLDLFRLRRCYEDLAPDPAFPGCVYSEMKKCLAPCFQGCTDERYAAESAAVRAFLRTRGASLVSALQKEREEASQLLEFEKAAELHARLTKAEAVAAEVSEVVRPLSLLNGIVVQPAAEPEHVALFVLSKGSLLGPALYSVVGMRHPNEAAGSTSLFAQPVGVMEALPMEGPVVTMASRDELEQRLETALAALTPVSASQPRKRRAGPAVKSGEVADYLCLFSRWYYRPQTKRIGEVIFAGDDGKAPAKAVLRAVSRVFRRIAG